MSNDSNHSNSHDSGVPTTSGAADGADLIQRITHQLEERGMHRASEEEFRARNLPEGGGAVMLRADDVLLPNPFEKKPDSKDTSVTPIRSPSPIGKTESPQNKELASFTDAQLRQLVTDGRKQLAHLANMNQETQANLRAIREKLDSVQSEKLELQDELSAVRDHRDCLHQENRLLREELDYAHRSAGSVRAALFTKLERLRSFLSE